MLQLAFARYLVSLKPPLHDSPSPDQDSSLLVESASNKPSPLPFDVYLVILRYAALADCGALSLVCRQFRPPAQKRLFASIDTAFGWHFVRRGFREPPDVLCREESKLQAVQLALTRFPFGRSCITKLTLQLGPCHTFAKIIKMCPALRTLICVQTIPDLQPDIQYVPAIGALRASGVTYLEIRATLPTRERLNYGMFNLAVADTAQILVLQAMSVEHEGLASIPEYRVRRALTHTPSGLSLALVDCTSCHPQSWKQICRNFEGSDQLDLNVSFKLMELLLHCSLPPLGDLTQNTRPDSQVMYPYLSPLPQQFRCDELVLSDPWDTYDIFRSFLPSQRLILQSEADVDANSALHWCRKALAWLQDVVEDTKRALPDQAKATKQVLPREVVICYPYHFGLDATVRLLPSYMKACDRLAVSRSFLYIDRPRCQSIPDPEPKKRGGSSNRGRTIFDMRDEILFSRHA